MTRTDLLLAVWYLLFSAITQFMLLFVHFGHCYRIAPPSHHSNRHRYFSAALELPLPPPSDVTTSFHSSHARRRISVVYTNNPKTVDSWIAANVKDSSTIGFDVEVSKYHSHDLVAKYEAVTIQYY